MSKPHLLLSLPSSGSDWLAGCIARATGWRYFDKEFFNPICNPIPEVESGFGCEMVSHYRKIAKPIPSDAAWNAWKQSGYDFNKEVFCAFNVPWFAKRFKCCALLRRCEDTFPPKRARVMSWYDAIWHSCLLAGYSVTAEASAERAREAHAHASSQLRKDCGSRGIFVIEYERLQDEAYVVEVARHVSARNAAAIANEIISTWKVTV